MLSNTAALDKVVRTDFPAEIAGAWDKLDAREAPDKVHGACLDLAKTVIARRPEQIPARRIPTDSPTPIGEPSREREKRP